MSSPATASDSRRSASLIVAMLTVFLLACLTYHSVLNLFFTGTDTLALIETSRVQCFGDIAKLLSEPLMAGTRFIEVARYYRPVAALSYSFDYAVWGLNPWGYQLTNLLLNALVASLAVLVLFELSGRDVSFAWLSGIIFAIHPILVESVPATDRRQDMLAAVFLLVSLALFLKYRRAKEPKRPLIFFSLVAYVLALASKEIAIILPSLVFAEVYLFSRTKGHRDRFLGACRGAVAYIAVTGFYLAWRSLVLGGIGGYLKTDPLSYEERMRYTLNVVYNYVTDLIYPTDLFRIQEGSLAGWWACLIVGLIAGYVLVCVLRSRKWNEHGDNSRCKALVGYLLIWLALPLLVFLGTMTFAHRSMYIPAIPFTALVVYPLVQSCRSLISLMRGSRERGPARPWSWVPLHKFRLAVATMGGVLLVTLLAYSPLMQKYGQWEDSARIAFLVLTQLDSQVRGVSQNYRIELYDLPDRIRSYEKAIPRAKEVNYLRDYSIESWLQLRYPGRLGEVIVRSRSWPWEFSGRLRLGLVRLSQRNFVAFVEMGPKSKQASVARR